MNRSPLHHVGIVVADLDAAKQRFTDLLGYGWGPTLETAALELRDADGNDLAVPSRVAFSIEAPHIELIEEQPGTIWECNGSSNLHHLGFFVPDLVAGSEHLTTSRCPLQLCGRQGAAVPAIFAYHRDETNVRLELLAGGLHIAGAGESA